MSFLNNILGLGGVAQSIGGAIKGTTEVFHVNETEKMHAQERRYQAALSQFSNEFLTQMTWFDSLINGLNRLPRPAMALGTIGLFVYAMVSPAGFSERMMGLALIPEPLWWLLGAVVGFYFGARELHHFRVNIPSAARNAILSSISSSQTEMPVTEDVIAQHLPEPVAPIDFSKVTNDGKTKNNAAISEWLETQRR